MSVAQLENDLSALSSDMSSLKRDMADLVAQLRVGSQEKSAAAINDLDEGAHQLYRMAAAGGTRSIKALSNRIDENPLIALLIALGLGYVGGRLLVR